MENDDLLVDAEDAVETAFTTMSRHARQKGKLQNKTRLLPQKKKAACKTNKTQVGKVARLTLLTLI